MSRSTALPALGLGAFVTVVCLAFVHTTRSDGYWISDCASKALTAARLLETGFRDANFDYPAGFLDPGRRTFPLYAFGVPNGDGFVSVFPLGYPALAAPFLALLGPAGLRWPAALGAGACAALFALWVAPGLGRRRALAAGAGFVLATPLFFYGVTVWEHTLTVAGVLAALLCLRSPGRKHAFAAGVAIGLATWLREELALMGLALVMVEHLRLRDARRTLALVLGGGLAAAALAAFNLGIYGSVWGAHLLALDTQRALAGTARQDLLPRIVALLVGWGSRDAWVTPLAAVAVSVLALGVWAEWRRPGSALALASAGIVGLACSGLALYRIAEGPPLPGLVSHNGLLSQVPLASVAGVGMLRLLRCERLEPLRSGVAAGLLFLVAASVLGLATQLVFGMGTHVGPRKLLPALPALGALTAAGLLAAPPAQRTANAVAALLTVAGLASSATAGYLLLHQKAEAAALQDAILARPEPFVLSGDATFPMGLIGLWSEKPTLHTPELGPLRDVVASMRSRGIRRFLALASQATDVSEPAVGVRCRTIGVYRGGVVGYWDTDLLTCRVLP